MQNRQGYNMVYNIRICKMPEGVKFPACVREQDLEEKILRREVCFDLLNENEVSDSEPFEMDFDETTKVWFQMTRPAQNKVNLTIRVYENDTLQLEEVIRETIHDPETICDMLRNCGFTLLRCADRMLDDGGHGTTWFLIATK